MASDAAWFGMRQVPGCGVSGTQKLLPPAECVWQFERGGTRSAASMIFEECLYV